MGKIVEAQEPKLGDVAIREEKDGVWRGRGASISYDVRTYGVPVISSNKGDITAEFRMEGASGKWEHSGHFIKDAGKRGEKAAEALLVKDTKSFLETREGKEWIERMERKAGFESYGSK